VLPERPCENLPEVSPEVNAWVAQVAPELAQVPVRELPEKAALEVVSRASAFGWGSVDLLTHDLARKPCAFHFSREALRSVDAAFDLELPSPIQGKDNNGQNFAMADLLAGRGQLLIFYDRDGIVYRNTLHDRNFGLASRIEFDTPAAGVLDNVHGLCAQVLLFGCVRIRSIVKDGEKVKVRAGTFTSESPVKVIKARENAAPANSARVHMRRCRAITCTKRGARGHARSSAFRMLRSTSTTWMTGGTRFPWMRR
jgi:hypothetical protein